MFDQVFTLDAAFVAMVVGFIVSFLLFWAPGLSKLWAKVTIKRWTMIALFLGVPIVFQLLGCYLPFPTHVLVVCRSGTDVTGVLLLNILDALKIGFTGLVASAGGYVALLKWAPELMNDAHLKFPDLGQMKLPNFDQLLADIGGREGVTPSELAKLDQEPPPTG